MKTPESRQPRWLRGRALIVFHTFGGLLFLGTVLGLTLSEKHHARMVQTMLSPQVAVVRTPGTWQLSFVIMADSMAVGGGIKIRFVKGFYPMQNTDPSAPNFVSATTSSRRGTIIITSLTKTDSQVPWDWDRNASVVTVLVQNRALYRGDTIYVDFGANPPLGRLGTSPTAFVDSILLAYDLFGNGIYQEIAERPILEILPRFPYRVAGYLPTTSALGAPVALKIVVLDEYDNLATSFVGTITLSTTDSLATFPTAIELGETDHGRKTIVAIFNTPGVHYMKIGVLGKRPDSLWHVRSNPIEVVAKAPRYRIFWGDLHSHSSFSHDGHGTETFLKARDVACLDFYALTDHTTNDWKINGGLTPQEWETTKREVIRYHAPGQFVTIPAYEFSAKSPSGHHNIYFNAPDDRIMEIPLLRDDVYAQVQRIWKLKDNLIPPGIEFFTVPHHSGIIFEIGVPGPLVSFGKAFSDDQLRPLIEIYSTHGSSEYYDPQHPLSYQSLHPSLRRGSSGPHYAQDAWAADEFLGVIASSDDHSGRPGLPYNGLAAVYATELTRDAIFDALRSRRTYGTTGQRLRVYFDINGHLMGSQIILERDKYPTIHYEIDGTDDLDFVEVLRWDTRFGARENGHPVFETIRYQNGQGLGVVAQFIDSTYAGSSIYYVRAKQKRNIFDSTNRIYRQIWAWSSPIWVKESPTLDTSGTKTMPRQLQLQQNYPNPFDRYTLITYYLPRDGKVEVTLYNLLGQRVRQLLNEVQSIGWHYVQVSGLGLAHGIYFVRLEAAGQVATQKIVFMETTAAVE